MFAILEILPKETGRFARLRERIHPPPLYLEEVKTTTRLPYYIIRAQERRTGIPWDEIAAMAGRCKTRMLPQAHVTFPPETGLTPFVPTKFPAMLLFNTAVSVLRCLNVSPSNFTCAVIDNQAAAASHIHKLIPFAQTITVCTQNTNQYIKTAAELFDEFGVSIIVSDDMRAAQKNLFTVSLSGDKDLFSGKGFTLTYKKHSHPKALSLGKIQVPEAFYLPPIEGISRFDFLCALYELCSVESIKNLSCETLFYAEREMAIETIGELIRATFHLRQNEECGNS
ncbi:MAG: hypothetical protein LBS36_07120 [Oscillospiraceae bacterium]|jgi:hypothetical protein|nr:hypothetical protein [Oscillospiraceae bacterium]